MPYANVNITEPMGNQDCYASEGIDPSVVFKWGPRANEIQPCAKGEKVVGIVRRSLTEGEQAGNKTEFFDRRGMVEASVQHANPSEGDYVMSDDDGSIIEFDNGATHVAFGQIVEVKNEDTGYCLIYVW